MVLQQLLNLLFVASEASHQAAKHGGRPELPNIFTLIKTIFPDAVWAQFLEHYHVLAFSAIVIIILSTISYLATRKKQLIPSGLQNAVEAVVEGLYNFLRGILGPGGERHIPFLGTLFLYILFMNLFGLLPGGFSSTSNLNTTLAMALVVFLYVQFTGIRRNGIGGYLLHLAGSPRSVIEWCMVPLNLPIHIIGELSKPVSLSLRLFGNITGEDVLIAVFVGLGISLLGFLHLPVGVPLHVPFIFLAILTSFVQALVFTLLSTIYFALMLPHQEEGEEGHH
ncbi:MAG: ATP synthase F0 subunit A [candidate division Zixibacteria bacterium CG_4_9_14_3_um_filter_46_8]|nr:MAG: ATP synthase F0 subunit A [candidate division Zixibacteria bacterium CG_4_9_14_3_um_filter_46_8]